MPEREPKRVIVISTDRSLAPAMALLGRGEPAPVVLGVFTDGRPPAPSPKLGTLDEFDAARIGRLKTKITCAVVSLPTDPNKIRSQILELLREAEVGVVEIPAAEDLFSRVGVPSNRHAALGKPVDLASLIGRDPHEIDRDAVGQILRGRRVLITGAGGSIGSELARACAGFAPERLILMERSENALFEIDRQLERRHPGVSRRALLHDVTNESWTRRYLRDVRPHVVFHAAAHKHVPLMEEHPADAVRNNVLGTRSIADASIESGVERFVLISSDKAVHPSSIMGATKRLAELTAQAMHSRDATRFSIVRFGNVLGSAGSVIPIWSAQLAEGGPITITDPRMTRYFMTIPEAAMLVLQASAFDPQTRAPVYVLDMAEPVQILDLAKRFVRSHGFEPWVSPPGSGIEALGTSRTEHQIRIVISGIRPGEKLHESLAYGSETLGPTPHVGIRSWVGSEALVDTNAMIAELRRACAVGDREVILAAIRRHVSIENAVPALRAG